MTQRGRSHDAADPDEVVFDLDDPAPRGPSARPPGGAGDVEGGAPDGDDADGRGRAGRRLLARPWPEAAPVWLRGPAAVVAIALVAAVLGGVLASHRERGAAARDLAVERVLGGVVLADPVLSAVRYDEGGVAGVGADGLTALRLELAMTNPSDTGAAVTITDVELGSGGTPMTVRGAARPQQLDALATGVAVLDTAVDCTSVPEIGSSSPSPATDWVEAEVLVAGEERTVRWGHHSEWQDLAQQLSQICHRSTGPWVDLAAVEVIEDGRLRVDVVNPGVVAASVDIVTATGAITGDPALPVVVEGGSRGSVVLTANPDCSRVDVLGDQTAQVVVGPVGGSLDGPSQWDPTGAVQLTAWMGRQTALVCS